MSMNPGGVRNPGSRDKHGRVQEGRELSKCHLFWLLVISGHWVLFERAVSVE